MKILVIFDLSSQAKTDDARGKLTEELRDAWALYKSGVIREAYATASASRIIFILEADDISQARKHLQDLPLVVAGMMNIECIELRPFIKWQRLFAP